MRKNKDKKLAEYFRELKDAQQQLVAKALDMKDTSSIDLSASNAGATLHMMSSFSPLFLQFLAWQRLMQLPDEVGLLDRGVASQALSQKRKREFSLAEEGAEVDENPVEWRQEEEEQPALKKQRKEDYPAMKKPRAEGTAKQKSKAPDSEAEEQEFRPSSPSPSPVLKSGRRGGARKAAVASKKAAEAHRREQEVYDAVIEAEEEFVVPVKHKKKKNSSFTENSSASEMDVDTLKSSPPPVTPPPALKPEIPVKEVVAPAKKKLARKSSSGQTSSDGHTNAEFPTQIVPTITSASEGVKMNTIFLTVIPKSSKSENPLTFKIERSSLPARIGRDPSVNGAPKKLAINLQQHSDDPDVKRVSHIHLEILEQAGVLHLMCLGRNGMTIGTNLLTKGQSVPVMSEMSVIIGPFTIIFNLLP